MAVRTYAQLISDISTYLTQKVTIVKHSTLVTNIVDTIFSAGNGSGARPYKVYTALLTQTSTNAPVATVLENTLGGAVTWSYNSNGLYVATATGLFTLNKTAIFLNNTTANNNNATVLAGNLTVDEFYIYIIDVLGAGVDGDLINTAIEIRVYP